MTGNLVGGCVLCHRLFGYILHFTPAQFSTLHRPLAIQRTTFIYVKSLGAEHVFMHLFTFYNLFVFLFDRADNEFITHMVCIVSTKMRGVTARSSPRR